MAFVRLSLTLALFDVLGELVEQVIDNLGSEDLDLVLLGELLSIRHDLHIESEQASILFVGTLVCRRGVLHGLEYVFLVDWTDVDSTDRDLARVQELEQSFE